MGEDRQPVRQRHLRFKVKDLIWKAPTLRLLAAGAVLFVTTVVAPAVLAHGGGTPQLVEELAGPYEIFAWSNPEPARVGTFHITVALVEPTTDQPVLDANVLIHAAPLAEAAASPIVAPATHQNATIKTYYETDMEMPAAGAWQVTVTYTDTNGTDGGSASFPVEVQEAGINWGRIALGVVLVILASGVLLFNRVGGRWLRK